MPRVFKDLLSKFERRDPCLPKFYFVELCCGPHSREFSEDKSILSHLSNLLFSSFFNTLNGNGIEGVDLKKKKNTMWGLCIKFYLGQNEDCSPGDSISDSSENLFQRGRREGQYICDFVKGEYIQSSTYFPRRFLLISGSFC